MLKRISSPLFAVSILACTPTEGRLRVPEGRFPFQALVDSSSGAGQTVRWAGLEVREPSGARQRIESQGEDAALILGDGTHFLRYVVTTSPEGTPLPASPVACASREGATAIRPVEGVRFFSREQSFTLAGGNSFDVALPAASAASKTVVVRIPAGTLVKFPALAGAGVSGLSTPWGQKLPLNHMCAPEAFALASSESRLLTFDLPLVASGGDVLAVPALLLDAAVDKAALPALLKASTFIDVSLSGPRDAASEDFDGDGVANAKESLEDALGAKVVAVTPKPTVTAGVVTSRIRGAVVCTPEHATGKPGESYGIACSGAYDVESQTVRYESETISGTCPTLSEAGSSMTTFGAAGDCVYRARACDTTGACTDWSPEYKVSSYTASASLAAPSLSSACVLTFSATSTHSANVTSPLFDGSLGIVGVSASATSTALSGVLDTTVTSGTYTATFGLVKGDVAGSPGLSSVFSSTASQSYVLQSAAPTHLVRASSTYMDGQQLPSTTFAANACVAAESSAFAQVAMGVTHACGVTKLGALQCWGANEQGQLGDGTSTQRLVPTPVVGLSSGVRAVSVGDGFTCALTDVGGVKCWGYGLDGRLGNALSQSSSSPVDVSGLSSGVKAIAAGTDFVCALTGGNGVQCWGNGGNGQLGLGSLVPKASPQPISGLASGVAQISAGAFHACAAMTNGTAKCWGNNLNGQLGNNSNTSSSSPVSVSVLSSGVVQVDAGENHTCALLSNGDARCWGANAHGQLGKGDATSALTPVSVISQGGSYVAVTAGGDRTCALLTTGGVECWGRGWGGGLGNASIEDATTPQGVLGLGGAAVSVSTQGDNSCALLATGAVKCWGVNDSGQHGDGATQRSLVPKSIALLSGRTGAFLAAGSSNHAVCAVTDSGSVQCWGGGKYAVETLAGWPTSVKMGLGANHGCVITNAGGVSCWGDNTWGQLGNNTLTNTTTVVTASGITAATDIALGRGHTCVLDGSAVKCWGLGVSGQVGWGSAGNKLTPTTLSGMATGMSAVAAGFAHSCAMSSAGAVKCWGDNAYGQLGDNSNTPRFAPVTVNGSHVFATIASHASASHTCGVDTDGAVLCWGSNSHGQLGVSTSTTQSTVPVVAGGISSGAASVAVGAMHTCARMTSGEVKCWGRNYDGQLGNGARTDTSTPVTVSGIDGTAALATQISAGPSHTCALLTGGTVKCWGANMAGELADPQYFNTKSTPTGLTNVSRQETEISIVP